MALARYEQTLVDEAGNILTGARVTVRREASGTPLANIYADRAGANPLQNPISVGEDGLVAFYAAGGAYRISAERGSYSKERRYVGIGRGSETDITGLIPRGAWDAETSFNIGDLVRHGGLQFASLADDNVNHEPPATETDNDYWMFMPTAESAELAEAWAEEDEDVEVASGKYSAKHYALKAEKWAEEGEDVAVETGKFSAKHHAAKSAEWADVSSGFASALIIAENTFATKSTVEAWHPSAAPDYVRIANGALYDQVESEPSHDGKLSITLDDGETVVWFELRASQSFSVDWFGTAADAGAGDTDDTAAIQAAIDARGVNGVIVIPPGNYYVPGDLTIASVAANPKAGGVRIEAIGAVFSGGGTIIVDSCKRLTINGLDAPSHVMHLRGCWDSTFENLRVQSYVVGEADGTGFSSCMRNVIKGGYTQAFVVHANMSSYCNENTIEHVNIAGAAVEGFSGTVDYGFEFNGNNDVQNLKVIGSDVSGFDTAVYNIGSGNTEGDVDLFFDEWCYFDTKWPTAAYGRNNVSVVARAHIAGKFLYSTQQSLRGATRGGMFGRSSEYTMGWVPWAAGNLIPNGDLNLNDLTLGYPISNANGATLTLTSGDGPVRRYIRAQHASGTTMYAATVALPFTANYCGTMLVRKHTGSSDQSLVVGLDGKEFFTINVGSEWVPVQVAPNDDLTGGSSVNLTFGTAAAMDLDVAYIGVHLGQAGGPLMLPQSPAADAATKSGTFTPTGTAVANVDSITPAGSRWTREGNIVTVSGAVAIDATAAGSATTQVRLTFPIPSDITSFSQVNGVATDAISGEAAATITGDATNNCALLAYQSLSTSSRTFQYMYQYELR